MRPLFGPGKGEAEIMKNAPMIAIGACLVIAAILHALISSGYHGPIKTGYAQGEILRMDHNEISHLKCNGCKVECYDSFIVVYIDREKEPSWTDNYLLTIPWDKVEHLTLLPR